MKNNKIKLHLNAFLVKQEYSQLAFTHFISLSSDVKKYPLDEQYQLNGALFIKNASEKKPVWYHFTEILTGETLKELFNKTNSAVLILKGKNRVMAFTFGHGRHLINMQYFEHDFGIKTALNTLDHDSLRAVDSYNFGEDVIQKKSQASKKSNVSAFGIDISKDILRAVTGAPKKDLNFNNISGNDTTYSFNLETEITNLSDIINKLVEYYNKDSYKEHYAWIDNIRKIKEKSQINSLDEKLIDKLKLKSPDIRMIVPNLVEWDTIYGFGYKRVKNKIYSTIEIQDYLDVIKNDSITINSINSDQLFVYDHNNDCIKYSIYNCIYFEYKEEANNKVYILFNGQWFEIDNNFINQINIILDEIKISELNFPPIKVWKENNKEQIESEGIYNERVAKELSYYLLDKKLIKSSTTTTSIELCDLLTKDKQFIYVKHRKGGSSGLSHLFAQGSVAAEILLGDLEFRQAAHNKLSSKVPDLTNIIPIKSFTSDGVEIIFLLLGEDSISLKNNLPFFSKVNLSKTYTNLTQKGFKVTIAGASKSPLDTDCDH